MSLFGFQRTGRLLSLIGASLLALILWTFWYGMNSDRDDIHPLLTQLIPAGHCACETATVFECQSCLNHSYSLDPVPSAYWEFRFERDGKNRGLTERECNAAFPGLFEDVDRAVKFWWLRGTITQHVLDEIQLVDGMTRAMVYDSNLYVIASKSKGEDHRGKMMATLASIHRAIVASLERIPDIEFIFLIEDKVEDVAGPGHPLWALARRAPEESLWLMPDFGYWAWDNIRSNIVDDRNHEIGSYDEVVDSALHVEKRVGFLAKKPKLVWRGKLSFSPKLRRALLDRSRDQPWSDVKEINWSVQRNYLALEDHCKYRFIAHAEGRSYSASLKYRQACRSVILIHKLQYIQHHHYLLVSTGPLQNFVQVERDFSDLPEQMSNLLDHPDQAQRIADNSVNTFRERYLTPAADACYWRALWRGYAQASKPAEHWVQRADGTRERRGLRYETFLLRPSQAMLDFAAP